ncbi:MAG TPA: tRNA pseudouridine(13) synthase TruD [Myxococcales bacterium]|nr:tRNA pseudouridine(13) synthase TruD [Myxococcales bacterium]
MSDALAPREVPVLTPDLPGTSGSVRISEEDFRVEEIPLYEPSGEGSHLYLTVEKAARTTPEVAHELAIALSIRERDVGYAGLKDKRAVAVQRFSVPVAGRAGEIGQRAALLSGEGWRVTAAALHGNKLRPGHLRGNRFRVVVRGIAPGALDRAERVCSELRARGAPNLYGPQRFGRRGDNASLGAAILRRDAAPKDRFLRRLALSALQAELFNRCLSARLRDGLFERAIDGDVLRKRQTGGLFVSEDSGADTVRVAAGEVDPAGPLPGHSLFAARGEALAREQAVLREAGIDERSFAVGGDEMEGARRPYRIPIEELRLQPEGSDALVLSFALPKGSYAACVLREVTKAEAPAEDL